MLWCYAHAPAAACNQLSPLSGSLRTHFVPSLSANVVSATSSELRSANTPPPQPAAVLLLSVQPSSATLLLTAATPAPLTPRQRVIVTFASSTSGTRPPLLPAVAMGVTLPGEVALTTTALLLQPLIVRPRSTTCDDLRVCMHACMPQQQDTPAVSMRTGLHQHSTCLHMQLPCTAPAGDDKRRHRAASAGDVCRAAAVDVQPARARQLQWRAGLQLPQQLDVPGPILHCCLQRCPAAHRHGCAAAAGGLVLQQCLQAWQLAVLHRLLPAGRNGGAEWGHRRPRRAAVALPSARGRQWRGKQRHQQHHRGRFHHLFTICSLSYCVF